MIDEKLQPLVRLVQKGLDRGFSGSYVIHQLSKRGHNRRQLEHALQIAVMPPEDMVETKLIDPKEKREPAAQKKPATEEVTFVEQQDEDSYPETGGSLHLFRDPASFLLIVILCLLFFALGVMIDRLFLAL